MTPMEIALPLSYKIYSAMRATAILLGVGIILYFSTEEWARSTLTVPTRVIHISLMISWGRILIEMAPPQPHPLGGPVGQPGDSWGVDIFGLTLLHRTLEWRNAGITWGYAVIGFPWWIILAIFSYLPLYRRFCRSDEPRAYRHAVERYIRVRELQYLRFLRL